MRRSGFGFLVLSLVTACLLGLLCDCAGMRQVAALRRVEFKFDRIADPEVAGIALENIRSADDVSALDLGRLALAIASKDVPLQLVVHLKGTNPESNTTTAKLVALDWTYLIDGRKAVAGKVDEAYQFPPGQATDVGIQVGLNLLDLYGGTGRDLLQTALALAGRTTSPHDVTMELRPVIDTPLGPMSYPAPINLVLLRATR